jgi:hypothetical protein
MKSNLSEKEIEKNKKRIEGFSKLQFNKICADCGKKGSTWAVWNWV